MVDGGKELEQWGGERLSGRFHYLHGSYGTFRRHVQAGLLLLPAYDVMWCTCDTRGLSGVALTGSCDTNWFGRKFPGQPSLVRLLSLGFVFRTGEAYWLDSNGRALGLKN